MPYRHVCNQHCGDYKDCLKIIGKDERPEPFEPETCGKLAKLITGLKKVRNNNNGNFSHF